ncbi:MAG: hypothetical protein J3R72DRAFT_514490 [Linnemannia gamsii]|nr:MAG: hypothetical protein J3R72DRAFT_514490 [Linnemannia gamsii]
MPPTTFSSLPLEVVDLIGPHLNHHNLTQCVLVNHLWHALFTPALWRTLRNTNDGSEHYHCFYTNEFWQAFYRNFHHIREFETTDPKFTIFTDEVKDFDNQIILKTLLSNNNTTLRTLSINEECFHSKTGEDVFHDIIAPSLWTPLEKLELSFDDVTDEPLYDDDEYEDMLLDVFDEYMEGGKELESLFCETLKEVVIHGGDTEIDPMRLLFLYQCNKIETIRLDQIDPWAMTSISQALQRFCPNLEFGQHALLAFNKRAIKTIEVLCVDGWGTLDQEQFLQILCSTSRLRRLEDASGERIPPSATVFAVDAYEAFVKQQKEQGEQEEQHMRVDGRSSSSWALGSSMEFLQLKITGVLRPDIICGWDGESLDVQATETAFARRYDVQRWIYSQLGRMTGLRELVLGIGDFNYESLEFSLESGLEVLGGLKELRVLDVRMMAHRIGIKELEWMRVNWPRLKEIKGLYASRGCTGNDEGIKVWENAVNEWMEAHPYGIGIFYYAFGRESPSLN